MPPFLSPRDTYLRLTERGPPVDDRPPVWGIKTGNYLGARLWSDVSWLRWNCHLASLQN